MKPKDSNKEFWRILGLYGFLSLNLGLTIAGGYFLGNFLEKYYRLQNAALIGVLVCLFLGLYEMFRIAYKAGQKK